MNPSPETRHLSPEPAQQRMALTPYQTEMVRALAYDLAEQAYNL